MSFYEFTNHPSENHPSETWSEFYKKTIIAPSREVLAFYAATFSEKFPEHRVPVTAITVEDIDESGIYPKGSRVVNPDHWLVGIKDGTMSVYVVKERIEQTVKALNEPTLEEQAKELGGTFQFMPSQILATAPASASTRG